MANQGSPGEVPLYDGLAADYDRFVDWEARLANELPFIRSLFRESGVATVLDSACGTGHHAIALAREGYRATGVDLSSCMIDRARERADQAGVPVDFRVGGLTDLAEVAPGPFDAVICLGNSLPHLVEPSALRATLENMAAVLRPGGLLLSQNRNYDRVWAKKERFMPLSAHREGDDQWLFFRFMDFGPETFAFNMVTLTNSGGRWGYRVGSTELRPLFHEPLERLLRQAGFDEIEAYGDYQGSPFVPDESGDLILAAQSASS